MMPEWLQVLYGIIILCMVPFCGWIGAAMSKNRLDIAKIHVSIESIREARQDRQKEIDRRCGMEHDSNISAAEILGRLERNIVRIGTKMDLDLEKRE